MYYQAFGDLCIGIGDKYCLVQLVVFFACHVFLGIRVTFFVMS